jgi:hypothetical protein
MPADSSQLSLAAAALQDCISKTINRIEQKLQGGSKLLSHVIYMLRSSDRIVQQRVATSLARHAPQVSRNGGHWRVMVCACVTCAFCTVPALVVCTH